MLRILICLFAITYLPFSQADESNIRVGVGLAERYAGLGLELEYSMNNTYSVSFSAGYLGKAAGAVGLNYYLVRPNRKYQIRLSGFYGRVSSANTDINGYKETKVFNGLSVGAGVKWAHFEVTLFYSDTSKYNEFSKELRSLGGNPDSFNNFGLSFGYQF